MKTAKSGFLALTEDAKQTTEMMVAEPPFTWQLHRDIEGMNVYVVLACGNNNSI